MNYEQLKKLEHSIAAIQAKLGVLRAELKRLQHVGTNRAEAIQVDIDQLERQVDQLQSKYVTGKEAANG